MSLNQAQIQSLVPPPPYDLHHHQDFVMLFESYKEIINTCTLVITLHTKINIKYLLQYVNVDIVIQNNARC